MIDDRSDPTLETARETVDDDSTPLPSVRLAAWHLFDAARFDLARRGFERLVAAGQCDADVVTALQQIYADRREFGNVALLIGRYLQEFGHYLSPDRRLDWMAARLDALAADDSSPNLADAALQLLETAAATGPHGWGIVLDPMRRATIDVVLRDPSLALAALEQFLYAPAETGLPAQARAQIEVLGCRHAADREFARSAERLLHAFGDPDAAYRVEDCRRAATPATTPIPATITTPGPRNRVQTVTIAGGHPALRSMARRDLASIGVSAVREIPPAWEATRQGKAIQATLGGSDLAVVIGPQIAHTTSDRVRTVAARLGVPVVTVQSAGIAAIRLAVERFGATPSGR